jgi:hypothetical protein
MSHDCTHPDTRQCQVGQVIRALLITVSLFGGLQARGFSTIIRVLIAISLSRLKPATLRTQADRAHLFMHSRRAPSQSIKAQYHVHPRPVPILENRDTVLETFPGHVFARAYDVASAGSVQQRVLVPATNDQRTTSPMTMSLDACFGVECCQGEGHVLL